MARSNPGSAVSFPAVFNIGLLLFTLAGGILLVSTKLTSQRPIISPVQPPLSIGDQKLDARLWEDPFQSKDDRASRSLNDLKSEIARRPASGTNALVLPVMIPGGPYSEDQETRIRCRFAIVSALGRKGYAPVDAEHLGEISMPWPDSGELRQWKTNAHAQLRTVLYKPETAENSISLHIFGREIFKAKPPQEERIDPEVAPARSELKIRYEWYRAKTFSSDARDATKDDVLVLWLPNESFEDDPLLRLPLVLDPLLKVMPPLSASSNAVVRARVIGPWSSSTLRAMFPGLNGMPGKPVSDSNPALWQQVKQVLNETEIYSATVSAMDEVLLPGVHSISQGSSGVRGSIRKQLIINGFANAYFFNPTDAQLAAEIIDELRLRNADVVKPKHHLVLISEWDTFYGRMLSLTFRAALAVQQTNISLGDFVGRFRESGQEVANLHSFFYLRGLDGRALKDRASENVSSVPEKRIRPQSIQDFLHWTPDANKAEGQAQFDYLSRLGERIVGLRQELRRTRKGDIKAIGIAGSDAYDNLLILQALRDRFPDVWFFTVDLDARFWHPAERAWARNLIVASGYGLSLHPRLQGEIPPFRNSLQTSIFTACLAALGEAGLEDLSGVPPRRFEIGNKGAVDLSIPLCGRAGSWDSKSRVSLHPLTRSEQYAEQRDSLKGSLHKVIALISAALIMLIYFSWQPIRKRSATCSGIFSRPLLFSEQDVGGSRGAEELIRTLFASKDSFCEWMALQLSKRHPFTHSDAIQRRFLREESADALIGFLNEMLFHTVHDHPDPSVAFSERRDMEKAIHSAQMPVTVLGKAAPWEKSCTRWWVLGRCRQRLRTRRFLNGVLDQLTAMSGSPETQILATARDARHAAMEICRWRIGAGIAVMSLFALVGIIAIGMGYAIWRDTFILAAGEPFSITSGISAWPNLILRTLSLLGALTFIGILIYKLRVTYLTLSRDYRLPLDARNIRRRPHRSCASLLWQGLFERKACWLSVARAFLSTAVYFLFGFFLFQLLGMQFEPFRGEASPRWDALVSQLFGCRLLNPFVLAFLLLVFFTIEATLRCRQFIDELSAARTEYPQSTRVYFKSQRGDVGEEYLDEWIDTHLIADLTEQVQRLLWFPGIILLLMIASRNTLTDHWPWSHALAIIIAFNFILAAVSMVILQRAAKKAKEQAEKTLAAKVKKASFRASPSRQQNDADQAGKLLEEIQNLRRGAYVSILENPVVGALFLAPGGTAVIQFLGWLTNR